MQGQQNYWESLQRKYEDKNKVLRQREQELRYKLEAMDAIIGDGGKKAVPQRAQIPPAVFADFKSCTCAPLPPVSAVAAPVVPSVPVDARSSQVVPPPVVDEKPGFFKCVFSLFGSSKPKSVPPPPVLATPQDAPVKEEKQSYTAEITSVKRIEDKPSYRDNGSLRGGADRQSCRDGICSRLAEPPAPRRISQDNQSCTDSICSRRVKSPVLRPISEDSQSCSDSTCSKFLQPPNMRLQSPGTRANYKNENCMCNPCMVDEPSPVVPTSYKNEICMCNPSIADERTAQRDDDSCNCSICTAGTAGSNKNDDDLCACSICSKMSGNKDYCLCNYGKIDFRNDVAAFSAPVSGPQPPGNGFPDPSQMSLKSMDLFYMKNVHDLASHQRNLLDEINTLEAKAKIYDEVFNQYKNVDFSENQRFAQKTGSHPDADQEQRTVAELKLENFLLKNELKDMRLEVRQYLERMEGPMQFKVESERYKCLQLEQKLEDAAKTLADTQELFQKEINSLKMQLCAANSNLYNLTTANEKLKADLEDSTAKCSELQEDLVRQKISEAATLRRMQAQMMASQSCGHVEKDECDLHVIARELSKILKECEPCGDCMSLPEDLTSAAALLKSLADLMEEKLPTIEEGSYVEKERKTLDQTSCSCSQKSKVSGKAPDIEVIQPISGEGKEPSVRTEPERATLNEETVSKKSAGPPGDQQSVKSVTDKPQLDQAEEKSVKSGKGSTGSQGEADQGEQKSVKSGKESLGRQSQVDEGEQKSVKSGKESVGQVEQAEQKSVKSEKGSISHHSQTDQGEQRSVKSGKESLGTQSQTEQGEQKSVVDQSQADLAEQRSVRSGKGSVSHQSQIDQGEQKSVQSGRGSISHGSQVEQTEQKSIKSAKESVGTKQSQIEPDSGVPGRKKLSCTCVEPRRRTPEREPVSSAETRSKRSCDCSVKKAKEKRLRDGKKCKCGRSAERKTRPEPVVPAVATSRSRRSCKCNDKRAEVLEPTADNIVALPVTGDGVDQLWPKDSGRFKLSHQVTASKSKELLQSETSIKCLRTKENFPFDVDTQVDIIKKPPDGVHVTTTITNSGTLEVITEGPEGVIETTLIYTNSGNVEVVTEVLEYKGKGRGCNRGTIRATSPGRGEQKAIEGPGLKPTTSEPVSGGEINANCQCIDCPALQGKPPASSPTVGEGTSLKATTSEPTKPPSPLEEIDSEIGPKETIKDVGDVGPSSPAVFNPDCLCIECPGLPPTETSAIPEVAPQVAPTSQAEDVQPENKEAGGAEPAAAPPEQVVNEGALVETPNLDVTQHIDPMAMSENIEINQHMTDTSLAVSIHAENPDGPETPNSTE